MRTSLFLSTLFTSSLIGGVALAEPPRPTDRLRAHGDVVDKSYTSPQAARQSVAVQGAGVQTAAPTPQAKVPAIGRAASRVNCADTSADCFKASSARVNPVSAAPSPEGGVSTVRRPAFLDKIMGSDRTNFNEAGEDQGMSPRAAKRLWASHAASSRDGSGAAASASSKNKEGDSEKSDGASEGRMSCNDADECSMANKDVKKIWAHASQRAGTFKASMEKAASVKRSEAEAFHAAHGATPTAQEHDSYAATHVDAHSHAAGHGSAAHAEHHD